MLPTTALQHPTLAYSNQKSHLHSWRANTEYALDGVLSQHNTAETEAMRMPIEFLEDEYRIKRSRSPSLQPSSPLELSPNFFPEEYSTQQLVPTSFLLIAKSCEETSSLTFRRNIYRMLYQKSPRQWRRINVAVTIPRESRHWKTTKISAREYGITDAQHLIGAASLPRSLLLQIQHSLHQFSNLEDDSQVGFCLTNQDIIERSFYHSKLSSTLVRTHSDLLTFLDDLGCPMFIEGQVAQIAAVQAPYGFASCVDGMLVYEYKICGSLPTTSVINTIQVFCSVHQNVSFPKFIGVVTDDLGKRLKGFIVELPRSGWNRWSDVLTKHRPLSWGRREKWARQFVEACRQTHSIGLVFGLSRYTLPIFVDNHDDLRLWRPQRVFMSGFTAGLYYPPEFYYLKHISKDINQNELPRVTPKADIFNLGMMLWHLAAESPQPSRSPWCIEKGCSRNGSDCSDSSHIDPLGLPNLPESVPKYYRDIISRCRAEDPSDRPAAWRLLKMFPPSSHAKRLDAETAGPESLDLSTIGWKLFDGTACDHCGEVIRHSFFHCNLCNTGDFDMCQDCYGRGLHCAESDHLLVHMELEELQDGAIAGKYHSSVKDSGMRDIVEL